jgi:hypothetical protein
MMVFRVWVVVFGKVWSIIKKLSLVLVLVLYLKKSQIERKDQFQR